MLNKDFEFLRNVDPKIYENLQIAKADINENPVNSMKKINASMQIIVDEVIKKEKIYIREKGNQRKTDYTIKQKIELLKTKKILDKKYDATFKSIRHSYEDCIQNKKIESDWVSLCLEHIYIICLWYSKRYYNLGSNVISFNPKTDTKKNPLPNKTVSKPKENLPVKQLPRKANVQINNRDIKIDTTVTDDKFNRDLAIKAYKYLEIEINNENDALLVLASANLLNAYAKNIDVILLSNSKFVFKEMLVKKLEEMIVKNIKGIDIYYNIETTYIKIFNLQFGFKYLKKTPFMTQYEKSSKNNIQQWQGNRLQPCSISILNQAEKICAK